MVWEIDSAQMHWKPEAEKLATLLSEGWEPFSVTQDEGVTTIWFRRLIERE